MSLPPITTPSIRTDCHNDELAKAVARYVAKFGDGLINPYYFSPPKGPNGELSLKVLAFHASYPEGRIFTRDDAFEGRWTRLT